MRLERLCAMDWRYTTDFHLLRPYGGESGLAWGLGDGTVTGERLAGTAQWSNQPSRRGDGAMLPNARGVVTTSDGAEVFVDLTGRTVFVQSEGITVGRQLLMALLTAEDERYAWLNNTVCMAEGKIDPERLSAHFEVFVCESDLL